MLNSLLRLLIATLFTLHLGCANDQSDQQKGISIEQISQQETAADTAIVEDAFSKVVTRPSNVLLTSHPNHRLVTVYKLIGGSVRRGAYIGTNQFIRVYHDEDDENEHSHNNDRNAWHNHYMPGIEAVHGVNLLNINHYDMKAKTRNTLFEHPVWVNTLYYPAFEPDTLNGAPVKRDYYLVSAYDEDTNKDSILNFRDLRRFYHFDLDGKKRTQLVPPNYSVISSEYDPANDAMFIFASLDANANGKREVEEPVHVFWISLKAPTPAERLY